MMSYLIDELKQGDWDNVREIHAEGIATGNDTFETETPTWERWSESHLTHSRFVARDDEVILLS